MRHLRAIWYLIYISLRSVILMTLVLSPLWISGILFIAFSSTAIGLALCPLELIVAILIGATIGTYHGYMWMRGVYLDALDKVENQGERSNV